MVGSRSSFLSFRRSVGINQFVFALILHAGDAVFRAAAEETVGVGASIAGRRRPAGVQHLHVQRGRERGRGALGAGQLGRPATGRGPAQARTARLRHGRPVGRHAALRTLLEHVGGRRRHRHYRLLHLLLRESGPIKSSLLVQTIVLKRFSTC